VTSSAIPGESAEISLLAPDEGLENKRQARSHRFDVGNENSSSRVWEAAVLVSIERLIMTIMNRQPSPCHARHLIISPSFYPAAGSVPGGRITRKFQSPLRTETDSDSATEQKGFINPIGSNQSIRLLVAVLLAPALCIQAVFHINSINLVTRRVPTHSSSASNTHTLLQACGKDL
jgi:hypothetical protein